MTGNTFDPDIMRAELVRDEGSRTTVYRDTRGNLTVGVGHNLTIPQDQHTIDALLTSDIAGCVASLDLRQPWWRNLDPVRQRVLINMTFQLGGAGLARFPQFLAAMQAGQWDAAAEEMMDSNWARECPARAARLRSLVLDGADVA